LAWVAFTSDHAEYPERTWAFINVPTATILALIIVFAKPSFVPLATFLVVGVRTTLDYALCWDFYFPSFSREPRGETT
jgi:hypothetical protein